MCSRGPEIHLCFLQNFADKTTDGKIRFSISFLVSFELFFQELFFGHKECFIQPYLPRAFSRWKNARRASHVYIRGWPPRGVTQNTYIYVVGTQRVNIIHWIPSNIFFMSRACNISWLCNLLASWNIFRHVSQLKEFLLVSHLMIF